MSILITGGSGFLARGILREWPASEHHSYVVFSRDEFKQDLCKQKFGTDGIRYVLGDVKDYDRLTSVIRAYDVSSIIHTAAVKFIPEAEYNVDECVAVNVDGTRNVLEAARYCEVESVIGISTDKACQPINTYGMTKALMERLFIEQARMHKNGHYALVRYGNVIGSTGSVIPLFEKQAQQKHEITVTDPDSTRYWITIEQAVALIGLAQNSKSGSIIIPRPRAMRLVDLAESICSNIQIIGPRPGEKRHEQLMHQQESVRARDMGTYYELCEEGMYGEPFILSSNTPEAGWFDIDEMKEAIVKARAL